MVACALTPGRHAHRAALARAVLVEDLLGGQQGPEPLQVLPDDHARSSPPVRRRDPTLTNLATERGKSVARGIKIDRQECRRSRSDVSCGDLLLEYHLAMHIPMACLGVGRP